MSTSKPSRLAELIRDGRYATARAALSRGADPNGKSGQSALMWAAVKHQKGLVADLIRRGAKVNLKVRGQTALHVALQNADLDIARLLIEAGASVDAPGQQGITPLMHAALHGDLSFLRYLLEQGAEVNVRDSDGNSALLLAAMDGKKRIVRVLLDAGAETRVSNRYKISYRKLAAGEPLPRWFRH